MKFKIRQMDWYKRRLPVFQPQPIEVKIPELQLEENFKCDMIVTYDDGNVLTLSGRVNQNDVKKTWAIHGIDHQGNQC
ncbi:hypothetical protein LCGC14_1740230, partial [marine sediment metagenome]